MTLNAAVGSINTGTGAIGTTVVISGLSFAPKVAIFWWNGSTGTVDANGRGDMQRGIGVATSTTSRAYATALSQDTPTSMVTNRMQGDAACIGITTTADAIDGLMDVQSFDSGGITLVVDDVFVASYRVHYLLLGGDNVVNATVSTFTKADSSTGSQSITSLAFRPNFLLAFNAYQNSTNNSVTVDSTLGIGCADASGNQWTVASGGNDAAANAQTISYGYDGEFLTMFNISVTGPVTRASFTQFTDTGFDISWLEDTNTARIVPFLAVQFASPDDVRVGNLLTQTDTTTDIVVAGLSFSPAGGLLVSHCAPKNAQDVQSNDDEWSMGAFNSTSSRAAMSTSDDDAAGTAVVSRGVSHDEVYQNLLATSGAIEGEMDVKSVDASGVTFIMDDADNAQNFVGYALFGAAPEIFPPLPGEIHQQRASPLIRM